MGTQRQISVVISVSESCPFRVVRVMFGISKRVTLLCFRALSEVFSLFLRMDHYIFEEWDRQFFSSEFFFFVTKSLV